MTHHFKVMVAALFLASCRERIIERRLASFETTDRISCHYSGYCFACGMKFDGKFGCGFGMHFNCDGHQSARVRIAPYEYHFDDDPGMRLRGEERVTLEALDPCR